MTISLITLEDVTLNASQAVLKQMCPFGSDPFVATGQFSLTFKSLKVYPDGPLSVRETCIFMVNITFGTYAIYWVCHFVPQPCSLHVTLRSTALTYCNAII